MKNLVRELNIENIKKNLIKAKYLKKLSYITIVIDLIAFISTELLEIIYSRYEDFLYELIFFIFKVI